MPTDSQQKALVSSAMDTVGGAWFHHRVDVDLSRLSDQAHALQRLGTPRAKAWSGYFMARAAGIGGDYTRASALASAVIAALDTEYADELRAMVSFWDVMRYAQSDGLMHYDEDLRIVIPQGPLLARANVNTPDVYRLIEQTDALLNAATFSAITVMTTESLPFFASIAQQNQDQLARSFCSDNGDCPEAGLLSIPIVARAVTSKDAYDLAVNTARQYAAQGALALAALAWIRAGDAVLDPDHTPFELGLQPLNSTDTTAAINTGHLPSEFEPPSGEALATARAAYDQARKLNSEHTSPRVAAHIEFREAVLAWHSGRDEVAKRMIVAAQAFVSAGDRRNAFRAAIAASAVGSMTGEAINAPQLAAEDVDYGIRLGAIRLLSRAAVYAQHIIFDAYAAYQIRELAIGLAHDLGATQILSSQLAEHASLLISLGQQRSGMILIKEAVDLHQHYLDAIPQVALFADEAKRTGAIQTTRLTEYSQVLDLVKTSLSLEDIPLARQYNDRLRALEAEGVVTVLGPLVGHNEMLIEIHANEFERAHALAVASSDPVQTALTLVMLERNDEATQILDAEVERVLETLDAPSESVTTAESLLLQQRRSRLEQALSMLLRVKAYPVAARLAAKAETALGEGRLYADSAKPFERPHFYAQLAAGLNDDTTASARYEETLRLVRELAEQIGRSHSAARFDAEAAYIFNDYIQHLLNKGDVKAGLIELEKFRARDFQQTVLATARLTGAARDVLNRWQRDEAALEIALRASAAGSKQSDAEHLARLRQSAGKSKHALLQTLAATAPEEGTMDTLLDAVAAAQDRDQSTLLVYHLVGDQSSVTVLRPGHAAISRRLPLRSFELRRLTNRSESEMAHADLHWKGTARQLYRKLIEPVEDLLPSAEIADKPLLGIVAFGDAHRVAFEALVSSGQPLVQRFNLFHSPSLLSYARGTSRYAGIGGTRAIGFNGDRLRYAEAEARMLDSNSALGPDATRAELLERLSKPNAVHVAAHAEPGPENPYFSFLRVADGDLYLHELRGRTMSAPLVTLSACDTASAERLRSDQATAFATTFIENGVAAVVVTRWSIDDELTLPLMRDFYAQLEANVTPARALGAAQRAALQAGGDRSHPTYWAAFQLIGMP